MRLEISFGLWLKRRRRLLDLTQEELAERVSCSTVTIRKLESDERRASKQLVENLAQALDIPDAERERFLHYARTATAPSLPVEAAGEKIAPQRRSASKLQLPPIPSTTRFFWGDAPDAIHFHGRSNELRQLRQWLLDERCRLVALLGMGGIGKTSLAVEVARSVAEEFEVVIWRSLRSAPPVEETIDEIMQLLVPNKSFDPIPRLDRQLRSLLEELRQHRCLLILDNVESILAEGEQAGKIRPAYAGYGELLERLGESSHQSCLLLTSREPPDELTALRGKGLPVRTLTLSTLTVDEGLALLAPKGLKGNAESWRLLTSRCSGNPLLLQIVGETIRDLFQGEIETFLLYETTLFSSVRQLLSEQFGRLPQIERDLLIWLALHGRTVGPSMLRQEMAPMPTWAELLDALHSLCRRSLVEQGERGFMLQSVVMEFVIAHLIEEVAQEISALQSRLLQRYALLHAQARQHVRESQTRLVLQPLIERLLSQIGKGETETRFTALLASLRSPQVEQLQNGTPRGYAAGNLLNLLVQLNGHVRGQNFSTLSVRQANLQGVHAQDANFHGAHFEESEFSIAIKTVTGVAFSPTGEYFFIASDTGFYCLRRGEEGVPLHRQLTPSRGVWAAAFTPDGNHLAAGGNEGIIRLWTTESGQLRQSFAGHLGTVWALCFSPDGTLMASGGSDGTVRVWDVQSGRNLTTLHAHTHSVRGICFSPNQRLLASSSYDGAVCVWALSEEAGAEELRPLRRLTDHDGFAFTVAFSLDSALLATGGADRLIHLWDVTDSNAQKWRRLRTLKGHSHYVTGLCFHPNRAQLASSSFDGTVRVWDTTSGESMHTLQRGSGRVWSVAFSPDGNHLAYGGSDQSVCLWELDGAAGGAQCIKVVRGYANSIRSVALSPDGTLLATASQDREARLWQLDTGRCIATLSGHIGSLWHVHFSPDGILLVSAGHDHVIRIWDVASGRCVHEIEQVGGCDGTSFHPNGEILATANLDHTVTLWDVKSWKQVAMLHDFETEVWAIAFSPNGMLLATGGMDGTVRLWDWHNGRSLCTFQHSSFVRSVNFSADGRWLASSSYDSSVCLWDMTDALDSFPESHHHSTRNPRASTPPSAMLRGSRDEAQLYACFSPDGKWLASAGADGVITLWEVAGALSGASPVALLEGHVGKCYSLHFRYDSRLLVSGGEDGSVRVWKICDPQQGVPQIQEFHIERPYERMKITDVTGLTAAQLTSLETLGAAR